MSNEDENAIMQDFDPDNYIKAYCKKNKCTLCDGLDYNNEPNGYGCIGLDKRIENMYQSILKRRWKKI